MSQLTEALRCDKRQMEAVVESNRLYNDTVSQCLEDRFTILTPRCHKKMIESLKLMPDCKVDGENQAEHADLLMSLVNQYFKLMNKALMSPECQEDPTGFECRDQKIQVVSDFRDELPAEDYERITNEFAPEEVSAAIRASSHVTRLLVVSFLSCVLALAFFLE